MSYGYYRVVITSPTGRALLHSNSERAFVISLLQDALSPRLLIGNILAHQQLASCIDLLAFSIRGEAINLIFFAIDKVVATSFIESTRNHLAAYQSEYGVRSCYGRASASIGTIKKLRGPHHALEETVRLHLLHEDWEYDRYSSIGFYLHDRRGDWMHIWRMTQLYDSSIDNYYRLIYAAIPSWENMESVTPQLLAS